MQCPFLRKMNVKYCSLYRKTMIPLSGTNLATERCSGPEHRECPLLREHHEDLPESEACPYLSVADVHYCDVAPVRQLIPCNRTSASRCLDDGHRYCQLYLAMADPRPAAADAGDPVDPGPEPESESEDEETIPMPSELAYAPNHMWLDRGDGGTCHVGVDAFFTRALGRIDAVSFPYHRDECRPVARFTVAGAVFDVAFPNTVRCTEINAHLVVEPSEVLRDPYGRGWLFEGTAPPPARDETPDPVERHLLRDGEARLWMDQEWDRLTAFAHDHAGGRTADTGPLLQDGGRFRGGFGNVLGAAALFRLHASFFSSRGRRNHS